MGMALVSQWSKPEEDCQEAHEVSSLRSSSLSPLFLLMRMNWHCQRGLDFGQRQCTWKAGFEPLHVGSMLRKLHGCQHGLPFKEKKAWVGKQDQEPGGQKQALDSDPKLTVLPWISDSPLPPALSVLSTSALVVSLCLLCLWSWVPDPQKLKDVKGLLLFESFTFCGNLLLSDR